MVKVRARKYKNPKTNRQRRHNKRVEAAERYAEKVRRFRSMPYKDYLQTPHWKATRRKALRRADNKCQQCGSARGLQVHHLNYHRPFGEFKSDLRVLCSGCHADEHPDVISTDEISQQFRAIIGPAWLFVSH